MGVDGDPVALAALRRSDIRPLESRAALEQAGGVQHVGDGAGAVVAAVAPAAVAAAPLVGLARDAVGGGDRLDDLPPGRRPGATAVRRVGRDRGGRAGRRGGGRRLGGEAAGGGGLGAGVDAPSSRPSSTAASAASATVRPRTGRVDFTVSGLQLRFPVRFRGELTGSRWKDLRYAVPRKAGDSPRLPGSPGRLGTGPGRFSGITTRFNRAQARKLRSSPRRSSAGSARGLERPRRPRPRRASPRAAAPR